MKHFICSIIGTGADAEGNQFRPALADLTSLGWTVLAEGQGRMLVRADHVPAFDRAAGVQPLRRAAMVAMGVPLADEVDDWENPELALILVRRMLYRGTPPANRDVFRQRLQEIRARVLPGPPGNRGSFTDDFDGNTGSSGIIVSSWTPSGGTAWTVLDGTNTWAFVGGPNVSGSPIEAVYSNTTDTLGVAYACDDQLSANQYSQASVSGAALSSMICCNRMTNRSNYFALRPSGAPVKLVMWKRVAGTFTQLGVTGTTTVAADAVCRLESSGDSHEAFIDGVSEVGPSNASENNTATRQGFNSRTTTGQRLMNNFEAGTLGLPYLYRHFQHPILRM